MLYTTNAFTTLKLLTRDAETCIFAAGSKEFKFAGGDETIFCSIYPDEKRGPMAMRNLHLVRTTDWYATHEIIPINGALAGMGVKERFGIFFDE
jgi:hypothetical protein